MPRVIHFEIPSDDPAKANKFYTEVFGWNITQWADQPYWICKTGERTEAGIDGAIIKKNGPDHPLVNTIAVKNLGSTIRSIEEHGGVVVVPRTPIPKLGWLAYFKDMDGNILGIMEEDPEAK
jgi:predicted enzyme related to lactoylglutathione lyase